MNNRETPVQAVTKEGGGYWILTPLQTDEGFVVLVNRGFVPPDRRDASTRVAVDGAVTVTGLLRMTEPKGSLLRANDPAAGRWYSRDVPRIAAAQGLTNVAPYFIDEDDTPNPEGLPMGGLTVTALPNNHLVYAMTWFGMAVLLAGATVSGVWREYRLRRGLKRSDIA